MSSTASPTVLIFSRPCVAARRSHAAREAVELGDDALGRVAVAVGGEADDVGEHHGDALVAARRDPAAGSKLGHCRGGQYRVQAGVELPALRLDLGEMRPLGVAQPLAFEGRADAGAQDGLVERLG